MDKNKKIRREEALKKAKQKKIIIITICVSAAVVITALIIFNSLQSESVRPDADGILDLTRMSQTMVYASVMDMLTNPENYLGKTIKIQGEYNVLFHTPERPYNFALIEGASGCCPQNLMFIWDGSHDYPEIGTKIEMTGIFSSYEGFDFPYSYLAVDDITVLK